jgi:hypothetical protein
MSTDPISELWRMFVFRRAWSRRAAVIRFTPTFRDDDNQNSNGGLFSQFPLGPIYRFLVGALK